ncbi:MAG: type IV secretion system protein [Pseudomonadota bacterium]
MSTPARAMVVFDPSSYSKLVAQLNQMAQEYQKQLQQLDQAIKQTGALTGTRSMGTLANGTLEQELRRYLPETWQDTMTMMNAAGLSGSATETQSLYNSLTTTYNPIKGSAALTRDPTGPIAQALDRRTGTTYAAMAASEQAYNSASSRIATYETLLNKLNTTTDLKASIDLQSRISAENGMILNELMRLNAIGIQQKAAEDNEYLTSFHQASTANRFDATKAADAFRLEE